LLSNQVNLKVFQTSSHPSVSFFEMPVPIRIYGGGQDTLVILNHLLSGEEFNFTVPFSPDSIRFDPDREILARSTVTYTATSAKPLISLSTISIQPNPISDHMVIGGFQKKGRFTIMDAMGRDIRTYDNDLSSVSVSFQNLPSGLYLVRTENEDGQKTLRILRE
jgi:hypothetical protein